MRCLFCGSPDIEGGSVDIDSGGASQRVSCSACGCCWFDVYELVGVLTDEDVDAASPKARGDCDAGPT